MIGGCLGCDDEGLEAQLFEPEQIPWEELAFRSTREALEEFLVKWKSERSGKVEK
jgi:hypothetical protein